MSSGSESPIVSLETCFVHRRPQLSTVQRGPGMDETEADHLADVLRCRQCWEKDREGIARLIDALGLSDQDHELLTAHVMGGGIQTADGHKRHCKTCRDTYFCRNECRPGLLFRTCNSCQATASPD